MAQNVATSIIKLNSAKRGAAGDTTIVGARRLAHRVEGSGRELPGDKMPADYRSTYAKLTIAIETLSESEYAQHQTTEIEEQVVVNFADYEGSVTRTYERVRARIGGESLFPPPEEDGPADTREIQFTVLEKQDGDGLDTAFSDVRDS